MYVRPILLYASEMWLPYLLTRSRSTGELEYDYFSSPIEKVHTRFIRDVFHLPSSTPIAPMLWELGRVPLIAAAQKQLAQFLFKLANDDGTRKNVFTKHLAASTDTSTPAPPPRTWTALYIGCVTHGLKPGDRLQFNSLDAFSSKADLTLYKDCPPKAAAKALCEALANAPETSTLIHTYYQLVCLQPLDSEIPALAPYLKETAFQRSRLLLLRERLGLIEDDNRRQRHARIRRGQRSSCPHCHLKEVEDSDHRLLRCPRFSNERALFPSLFPADAQVTRLQLLSTADPARDYNVLGLYLYLCHRVRVQTG